MIMTIAEGTVEMLKSVMWRTRFEIAAILAAAVVAGPTLAAAEGLDPNPEAIDSRLAIEDAAVESDRYIAVPAGAMAPIPGG